MNETQGLRPDDVTADHGARDLFHERFGMQNHLVALAWNTIIKSDHPLHKSRHPSCCDMCKYVILFKHSNDNRSKIIYTIF